jgi:hypothetical protein
MPFLSALLLIQFGAAAPADDYRLVNPKAIELFEAEPRLMRWAVGFFDNDRDGYLSISEADRAARTFKRIADGDDDGQVTPAEFRAARDFVVARWVGSETQAASR